ncbi:probable Ser/Thr protein phosphatase superfamily [Phialocephala subalpina]|uniref:Probable Ser/Thr protein phosphatase superfamily n=1 Tax=Phialocephala subalpina TaxID=576137 RepID=A0A1L7WEL1_9HELO|nr:probable Ser/Thr protein phosphatase superfamily [Phialocephala subalpina]
MSSIQIISDLHLEAPKSYDLFEIIPTAPCLALIGDIGCVKDPEYFSFLERQLYKFKTVFLILGNHEPYHSNWATVKQRIRQFEEEISVKHSARNLGLFVFMDQTRYDISPNITLLGCTLFSNVLPSQTESVSFGLNDFYHIEGWAVEDHNRAHIADLGWLNAQVKSITETEPGRKITILTHYSPTTSSEAIDPMHSQSKISSGFSTDLSGELCWTNEVVQVWAFGHTHFNCDLIEESTGKRVLTNQRGYYFSQSAGFDASMCIEMGNHPA